MTTDPHSSQPNTYVFDPESGSEMARLINLDQLTTKGMKGAFTGLPDLADKQQVLDIACGPGGWVLDVAYAYPDLEVAGIDISKTMIDYARARARSQGIRNASFEVMNVLEPLEFSDNTFDVINARFVCAFLPRGYAWFNFINEVLRILRPGGVFRWTETDDFGVTNSPAQERFTVLGSQAMKRAGYGFSLMGNSMGVMHRLPQFFRGAGFTDVQVAGYAIDFSAGSEAWANFYRTMEVNNQQIQPLLVKMGMVTQEEIERLYLEMLADWNKDDFCGLWCYSSTWGTKPE